MHRRYDTTNIPIELLRTLVSVCDLGTLTKAADVHKLTQPAISAQIRRLQQIVGAAVLQKWGAGVRMTEHGEMVVRYARRILAINDQILLQSRAKADPRLARISLCSSLALDTLPRIFESLRELAPSGPAQIECVHAGELSHRLANGYVDVAVMPTSYNAAGAPAVTWAEPMVWVCAQNFLLSPGKPIPLIAWPGSVSHQMAVETLDRAGQLYAIMFTSDDWSARLAALQAGLGYIVAPERVAGQALSGSAPNGAPFKIAREHFLPRLPDITVGIFARQDVAAGQFEEVIAALARVFRAEAPDNTTAGSLDRSRQRTSRSAALLAPHSHQTF